MPTSEVKTRAGEPGEPSGEPEKAEAQSPQAEQNQEETRSPLRRGAATSRWVDYETHELLQVISELEDERRWARLREGIWVAILVHILLLSAITWIPKYVFRVPPVIDPFDAIKQRKDLSYLDLPPDVLKRLQPKVQVKPVPERESHIDRKTLEELKKSSPTVTEPTPQPVPQQTPVPVPPPEQKTQTTPAPVEPPHPTQAPKPNFAMGSANPADQLREAMRGASRNSGPGVPQMPSGDGMSMHPGAGSGGVQILSDTQGVDFNSWLLRWHRETERNWDPLIPDEVNPPILKKGVVVIRFKVLPNGRLMEGSMVLEGRSGDTGLDRAAWGALTGSNYPPLPREFHGPYLELRAVFLYNMEPQR